MYHNLGTKGNENNLDGLLDSLSGGGDETALTDNNNFGSLRQKKTPAMIPLGVSKITDATRTATVNVNRESRLFFGIQPQGAKVE